MRENGDAFVEACEVYWGQWIPWETAEKTSPMLQYPDPESIFIEKETLSPPLPKECRTLIDILLNIPEEMYLVNGKIKKTFLRKFVKEKTGWSIEKTERVQSRLYQILASQR